MQCRKFSTPSETKDKVQLIDDPTAWKHEKGLGGWGILN